MIFLIYVKLTEFPQLNRCIDNTDSQCRNTLSFQKSNFPKLEIKFSV
jgi:hypothetical protein